MQRPWIAATASQRIRTTDETNDDTDFWSHLPIEIVDQVLLHLPVKSLLRFRAVCRRWKTMISHPDFATKHLQTSVTSDRYSNLVTINEDGDSYYACASIHSICITPYSFELLNIICPFGEEDDQPDPALVTVLASCNGLLLARHSDSEHILWNPATREMRKLPPLPWVSEYLTAVFNIVGFAYDEINDDYKVAVFFSDVWHHEQQLCLIYSSRCNEWRQVDVPGWMYHGNNDRAVVLNGALHWLSYEDETTSNLNIVALDLVSENVREIGLPDYGSNRAPPTQRLWVFEGCLCVIALENIRSNYEFWVMKDYGVGESWTLLFQVPCWRNTYFDPHPEFLWFSTNGGKLLIWYRSTWIVFDTKRQCITRGSPSPNHSIRPVTTYVESLVSPNII